MRYKNVEDTESHCTTLKIEKNRKHTVNLSYNLFYL